MSDNDLIIAALSGLPSDYDMIRTVILARDSPITLKEFRAQLIGAEKNIEARMQSLVHSMAAMYVNAPPAAHSSVNSSSQVNGMSTSSGTSGTSSSSPNFGYGFPGSGSSSSSQSNY